MHADIVCAGFYVCIQTLYRSFGWMLDSTHFWSVASLKQSATLRVATRCLELKTFRKDLFLLIFKDFLWIARGAKHTHKHKILEKCKVARSKIDEQMPDTIV